MGDIGIGEILVIGVVALVLFKPEDVPEMMRRAGVTVAFLKSWVRGIWQGWQA